jgi:hypothetical protein
MSSNTRPRTSSRGGQSLSYSSARENRVSITGVMFAGAVLAWVIASLPMTGVTGAAPVAQPGAGPASSAAPCLARADGLRELATDMSLPHDIKPNGVPDSYDWSAAPRVGMGNTPPPDWSAATMWGQIYLARGSVLTPNTRVQIRNPKLWVLSRNTNQWRLLQSPPTVEGAAYREDFAGDVNVPIDIRPEPDGGISVRMIPGRNFHFWPAGGRATINPTDIAAIVGSFEARIIMDNANGPDHRTAARLVGSGGGDYWRNLTAQWSSDWSNNGDFAIGRFKQLCSEWRTFSGHSMTVEQFIANPPRP